MFGGVRTFRVSGRLWTGHVWSVKIRLKIGYTALTGYVYTADNWQRHFHSADKNADNSSSGRYKWPQQRSNKLVSKNRPKWQNFTYDKNITSWFLFVFTVGDFEKSVRAALTIFSLYVCLFSGLSTWSDHPVWRFKTIKKVSSGAFQFISILAFRNLKCAQYQQNKAPDWWISKFPPKWWMLIGRTYLKWLSSVSHQKIISSFVTTFLENYYF